MKTHENYRGARHHTLILMFVIWLTLSLAPAMVAPPKREFAQGQPEMQQSMDNMVRHQAVIQKRRSISPSVEKDYQEVNVKTFTLLAEAEKVLSNLPDSKERHWIESFVERMREIAAMLEKTAHHKNFPKNLDFSKGTPVLDGLPKQPTRPAIAAVPEINPFQKSISMISKSQITSSEINKVLPDNKERSEHHAGTKTVTWSNKAEETESDELVRELESLHQESNHQAFSQNSEMLNQVIIVTTPSVFSASESSHITPINAETEKANLKNKLIEEIAEFRRLGGIMPKEVIDVLYSDSQKTADSAVSRNRNIDDEMKFTESGMKDRKGMLRLDDLHYDDSEISETNLKNMLHSGTQIRHLKFNHTFENKHPNLLDVFPKQTGHYYENIYPLKKVQPYEGRSQSIDRHLQKINPYNYGKYHDVDMINQPIGHIPDALKQKLSKTHNFYNDHLTGSDYNNHFMKHEPYPYTHNWNPKNSTIPSSPMPSPYVGNQAMNSKIGTQLSDEMKRELRDGKIIVLSDSVVRSNFQPDKIGKIIQSTTVKPLSQKMDMKTKTNN